MAQRANAGYGVYGVQVYDFNNMGSNGQARLLSDEEAGIDPDIASANKIDVEAQSANTVAAKSKCRASSHDGICQDETRSRMVAVASLWL